MTFNNLRVSVALLGLAVLGVCGPAAKADDPPGGSGVSIRKVEVDSGPTHTVNYIVTGGSPRLQALVRRLEWAENEMTVIEELQRLKLDTVINERRVAAFRTAQLTNPYYAPGFFPNYVPVGAGGFTDSPLQRSLKGQLAFEATPQAAQQLIGFLEQVQTDLNAELKALPPAEKKAAEGPVEDLQSRVAALPHGAAPPAPAQPAALPSVSVPSPAAQGLMMPISLPAAQGPMGPIGLPVAAAGSKVVVEWSGTWYAAEVMAVSGGQTRIHYTGYDSSWDEWVPPGRIRPAGTVTAVTNPYRR